MSNKKLQVFVSSTFEDLKEERQAAVEAILSAGHIPAGMELFTAGDETQMTVIKRWIDESDVYLLILGGRYGSVDKASGKSYTQLEYEYAVEKGKALFAVVITEPALEAKVKANGSKMIEQDNPKELRTFREEVKAKLVKFWDDRKDIKLAIHETLNDFSYRKELVGWVRGDNAVSGNVAEELARLGKENEELRNKLDASNDTALFAGLTYKQMKQRLESESYGKENSISLFQYLLYYGHHFISGFDNTMANYFSEMHHENIHDILEGLKFYRIVYSKEEKVEMGMGIQMKANRIQYYFTDDGHSFYMKTLVLNDKI